MCDIPDLGVWVRYVGGADLTFTDGRGVLVWSDAGTSSACQSNPLPGWDFLDDDDDNGDLSTLEIGTGSIGAGSWRSL